MSEADESSSVMPYPSALLKANCGPWVMRRAANNQPDFLAAEDKLADWNMRRVDAALRNPADMAINSPLYVLSTAKMPDGEPLPKSWIAAELLDNIHAAQ